jgi:flagellar hook-associated protein 2
MYGLRSSITGAVAQGTSTGGTFAKFGIDTDMDGNLTFDAAKFAQAYASDPAGTKAAIADTLAGRFATTATDATAGGSGTITQALTESSARSDTLNKQIDNWTARLGRIQSDLQTKYGAMETALSKLQGQQSYLKSMFASMDSSSGSSS